MFKIFQAYKYKFYMISMKNGMVYNVKVKREQVAYEEISHLIFVIFV